MKVLILGAGTVGSSITRFLYENGHEVTVVDHNAELLAKLAETMDARMVKGSASLATTLFEADAPSHQLCLALTSNDEVNLVASHVAKSMGVDRTAARVYSTFFRDLQKFNYRETFKVDRFLGIEYLTALEIARQIRDPDSMMIEHFAQGHTEMQEVSITRESASTGVPLSKLQIPGTVRVGSIWRDGAISIASASDTINPGDKVTFLGDAKQVEEVKKLFVTAQAKKRNVIIVGGGEIAYNLAGVLLERNNTVKLLEADEKLCADISKRVSGLDVIRCDALRRNVLLEERAGQADYFVAVTNDDENNVMACVEAKSMGAKKTIAVVKHSDYGELFEKLGVDKTVSPYEVMKHQVEGLLHTGALIFSNPYLLGGDINVVELTAQADSPITASPLKDCGIPSKALLASVVREMTPCLPNADFRIEEGDTAVALVHASEEENLVRLFSNPKNSPRPKKATLTETILKSLGN